MSLNFNGSTQYGAADRALAQPMTWSFWYKPEATVSATMVGGANTSVGGTNTYYRILHLSGRQLQLIRGTTGVATTANLATLNAWNHALGIFNTSTNRSIRLNGGTAVTNTTSVTNASSTNVTIGAFQTNLAVAEYFDGSIAELGIWEVVLTDAEQLMLSKGVSPLLVRPASLMLYFPLVGRNSPEIELTNSYNMTLTNSPTVDVHPRVYMPASWEDLVANAAPVSPGTRIPKSGVTMLTSPIGIV